MGSTGSGSFGNYRIGRNGGGTSGSGSGSAGGMGGTGEIECPKLIENIRLEDVAVSEYYVNNNSTLPATGTKVQIRDKVHFGRLVIETEDTKQVVGNLPTQYNYLLTCITNGMHYSGEVISSGNTPVPFVVVTLNG